MVVAPIEGPLLEPLLIMECLIIAMTLEFGILFLLRAKSLKNRLASSQEFAYGIFFLGYSAMWIFYIFADYPSVIFEFRILLVNLGYVSLIVGAGSFIYLVEYNQIISKSYFYSKLFLCLIGVYILVLLFATTYYSIMAIFFWLMFIIFFTVYF